MATTCKTTAWCKLTIRASMTCTMISITRCSERTEKLQEKQNQWEFFPDLIQFSCFCHKVLSFPKYFQNIVHLIIGALKSFKFTTNRTSITLTATHTNTALTSYLVDILQRQAEGLVSGACGRLDGIQSLQQCGAWGITIFAVDLPALEPGHLWKGRRGLLCLLTARWLQWLEIKRHTVIVWIQIPCPHVYLLFTMQDTFQLFSCI